MIQGRSLCWLAFAMGVFGLGCERKTLHGRVLDNFGHPVIGAQVEVEGSAFQTRSDAQGAFELAYAPGTLRLRVTAPHHLTEQRTLTIAALSRYPLGTVRLLREPAVGEGLAVQQATEYQVVEARPLVQTTRVDSRTMMGDIGCRFFDPPTNMSVFTGSRFVALLPRQENTQALFRVREGHLVGVMTGGMLGGPPPSCPSAERLPIAPVPQNGGFLLFETDLSPGVYCVAGVEGLNGGANLNQRSYCFRWSASEGR